ncbi:hypothetical protein BMS3Bbin04_00325 [bacterium BMS3Bbin04]|nr:hypothetical protein BMS3Bbin04_00325 [bacterium BMS3Bbin04]
MSDLATGIYCGNQDFRVTLVQIPCLRTFHDVQPPHVVYGVIIRQVEGVMQLVHLN